MIPVTPKRVTLKIHSIKTQLKEIKHSKSQYYQKFKKYKKIDMYLRLLINICNAITLCSIIVSMDNPIALYISIACSTISTVSGAVYSTIELPSKIQSSQTSWLQLKDLFNSYSNILLKNHLSSEEYDNLLSELNVKTGLIYDSSLPIDRESEISEISIQLPHTRTQALTVCETLQ
jgi:hypothetical protein